MRAGGFNHRPRRIAIRQRAILINSDGVENEVYILDISSSGFRLQVSDLLRVGELVTLRVERESIPAKIVWLLGEEAGGVFIEPVDRFDPDDPAGPTSDSPRDGDRRTGDRRDKRERRGGERRQGDRRE